MREWGLSDIGMRTIAVRFFSGLRLRRLPVSGGLSSGGSCSAAGASSSLPQLQATERPTHRRWTNRDVDLGGQSLTHLFERSIRPLLQHPVDHLQILDNFTPAATLVWFGRDTARAPVVLQQVLHKTHTDTEWSKNLLGIKAVLQYYSDIE